jgi:Spy/CpxP family protein refolding chaperone
MRNTILSLLLVAASALAGAQSLPSAPHLDLAHRGAFLLNDPAIQTELALTPAQKAKLDGIFTTYSDRQNKLLQAAKPDDKALIIADKVASDNALKSLTESQRLKLMRAAVKAAGISALVAPDIAAKLKLKPAQVKRIQAVLDKAEAPIVELEGIIADQVTKDPSRGNEVERSYRAERARRAKLRVIEEQKALSILTQPQRLAWQSMAG